MMKNSSDWKKSFWNIFGIYSGIKGMTCDLKLRIMNIQEFLKLKYHVNKYALKFMAWLHRVYIILKNNEQ